MRNNEIEKKLSADIEAVTPNNYEKVLSACGSVERKGKVLTMKKRFNPVKWASAIAAALVLVMVLTAVIGMQTGSDTITSVVSIDVNPGIELSIGKNDTVKKAVATNDDGARILEGLELKDVDVDTAVSAIIGEMLKAGYISADANSVLITVDTKGDGEALRQHLTDSVTELLKAESIEAAVRTQIVTDEVDDAVKALAKENQMSHGKARLICELVTRGGAHTFDELKALTVNELLLLLDATGTTPDDVTGSGSASDSAYIGKDAVVAIALSAAGLTAEQATGVEVELDYKKGAMIYEVEFKSGSNEYEYKIDASTGEILKSKVEADDEDDDDDDDHKVERPEGEKPAKVERPENLIGKEAAVNAALAAAGFSSSQAGEIECDLECKGGVWFYEIEFEVEANEYEYRIDATSAAVIDSRVEADDDKDDDRDDHDDKDFDDDDDDRDDDRDDHDDDKDDKDEDEKHPAPALPENLIGEEAAINAAITAAGLNAEQIVKKDCELEHKGETWVYEVELETADTEYKYVVDAVSAAILAERTEAEDNKPDADKAPEADRDDHDDDDDEDLDDDRDDDDEDFDDDDHDDDRDDHDDDRDDHDDDDHRKPVAPEAPEAPVAPEAPETTVA